MDTAETPQPHPNSELARMPEALPAFRMPLPPATRSSGGLPISPRLVLRGLARHWWQALTLWVVGTAALAAMVYVKYKPTYKSSAILRVEPNRDDPFAVVRDSDMELTMMTHVQLMTSPVVLKAVVNEGKNSQRPSIQGAEDPEKKLREMLNVSIRPKTYLIDVSATSSHSTEEATSVVKSVVDAFLLSNRLWSNGKIGAQLDSLRLYREAKEAERDRLIAQLREMLGNVDVAALLRFPGDEGAQSGDGGEEDARIQVDIRTYRELQQRLLDLQMQQVEAQASLDYIRHEAATFDSMLWVDQRVKQEFLALPEVERLRQQSHELDSTIEDYQRRVRNPNDPSIRQLQERRRKLMESYERLWEQSAPLLRDQLAEQGSNPEQAVRKAERAVVELRRQEALTREQIEKLDVTTQRRNVERLDIKLITAQMQELDGMIRAVKQREERLAFESNSQDRILQVVPPSGSKSQNDKRSKYLAMTPIAMLGLVLGLVTLVELRAGRVSGADELSARMPAEVFAVPPLPTARPSQRKLGGPSGRDEDQFEQFVQQLDHVRVALCGDASGRDGLGRCVLITSAVGGEGKTTLAAQLAVRCAEAGASTVLIDADLRRAMLGQLFEVPECPGLSDVLRGDAKLEDALVPIKQVGGCQLLPAGSPESNPNRVLRGKAFGPMLERLRRGFDVVIVDTSPVLPVPDALILGRYADGAVLATRHDQSRFPAVERANHLLAGAGIPVLGVVVNGARPSGSRYSNFAYNYRRPERSPESADRPGVDG